MSANFTPDMTGYKGLSPFRFWCQKTLPLVYDDSLSYYELLCKVVNYINNLITDVSAAEENVDKLLTAYNQLQEYVNEYFDGTDFQQKIDDTLDRYAEDGTLSGMVNTHVSALLPYEVGKQIGPVVDEDLGPVVDLKLPAVVQTQLPDAIGTDLETIAPPVIKDWLDAHPEATTSVPDGSITFNKLATDLQTDLKSALKLIIPVLPNGLKINITDTTITIPAYTRMYYGKNYIYRVPDGGITVQRQAPSSGTVSEEYLIFNAQDGTFECIAGWVAGIGENKYFVCGLSKGLNGCTLPTDMISWDGQNKYEKIKMAHIVPPNNLKINITDTTITIPAYTRMYYGRNYIFRAPDGGVVVNRVATSETTYSEERLVFDASSETFSCIGGTNAALDPDQYLVCTLSKGLNGCSLPIDYIIFGGSYKFEKTLRADIVPPNDTKINITETIIEIPAYTRMYYRGNLIYRVPDGGITIQRVGGSYSEERLIFNSTSSQFTCIGGPESALTIDEYVVCLLSKGLNGCSLSPNFVTWNGVSNCIYGNNILDVNDWVDVKELLENSAIIRRSDNFTDPFTPVNEREDLFALLHISDIHGDGNAVRRMLKFYNYYHDYIFDVIHTGDAVTQYYGDYTPFNNTSIAGANKVLQVIGNHECWIEGDTWPHPYSATEQEVYNEYISPNIAEWDVVSPGSGKCYYYKDYPTSNLRMIVLDCIHFDSAQSTWFASVLSSARQSDLRVVAVSHYHAQKGNTGYDTGFNTYGYLIAPVETPVSGAQIERLDNTAYDIVDDFIEAGGEFVCWLTGHEHTDSIGVINGHPNQIEVIISTGKCAESLGYRSRAYGTKVQDLFNVFFVDGVNKLIKIVRVGATMDKFMRSSKAICINYQTKQLISSI